MECIRIVVCRRLADSQSRGETLVSGTREGSDDEDLRLDLGQDIRSEKVQEEPEPN